MDQPNTPFNEEELLQAAEEAYEKAVADQPASDLLPPEAEDSLPVSESDEPVLLQEEPQPEATQKSFIANAATNGTVIGIAIGLIAGIGIGFATRAVPACLVLGLMLGLVVGLLLDMQHDKKAAAANEINTIEPVKEADETREDEQHD